MSSRLVLALLLALPAGCRTVVVSPASVRASAAPPAERERALEDWNAAVLRANAFLRSPFRRTLPAGAIELDDTGMRFLARDAAQRVQPLRVDCSDWGDLLVALDFAAQEGAQGFTVGSTRARGWRELENSFFRAPGDNTPLGPDGMATLLLHELTHDWTREGAFGFWKSAAYFLEFLCGGYAGHSDERAANATDEEFQWFARSLGRDEAQRAQLLFGLEQHLLASRGSQRCRHGTADELNAAGADPRP